MTDQELKLFIKKHRLEEVQKSKYELLQELTGIAGQLEQTKEKLKQTGENQTGENQTETDSLSEKVISAIDGETEKEDDIVRSEPEVMENDETVQSVEAVPCVRKANKVIIGIAGTQHRIGCTHAGIMLGSCLKKSGFHVALLEYGRSDALEYIADARDKNFDTYENVTAESLLHILSSKCYNFLLIDYGLYEECDQLMYNRSDIRLLLAGAKEWETKNVSRIFENTQTETLRQMTFLFNFVEDTQQKAVRREMAELGEPYFLPLLADPFAADTEKIGEIRTLFREYMEEQPENKWKKFLKRGSAWKN